MKLKNFKKYSSFYSKDPKNFEKRIAFASSTHMDLSIFECVSTSDSALTIAKDIPVISWKNFSFGINESFCSTVYNQGTLPHRKELVDAFKEEEFIPKIIKDRSLVKKMNFPIVGVFGENEEEFKTFGKFKKSETFFNHFKEKLVPTSRFEILVTKDEPIHVQKKINNTSFDVDLDRWKHLGEASNICNKIHSKYSPDFYIVNLLEANGQLYLESVNQDAQLTPSQGIKLYESAYQNYYQAGLPSWFKRKIFEDHVKPYYAKKYYDSLLFKPSGTIDYSKYI